MSSRISLLLSTIVGLSLVGCLKGKSISDQTALPSTPGTNSIYSIDGRKLRFHSEKSFVDAGARLSVRQITTSNNKLLVSMGKWQSSGSYAYLALDSSDLQNSLLSSTVQLFPSSGSWGGQSCANSVNLFDTGWVSTQQFFTIGSTGTLTNIFQQSYFGPLLNSTSCAFKGQYLYVGGSADGTVPNIWTINTSNLPGITASDVVNTATLSGSGFLMNLQVMGDKLFAKMTEQNKITVYSLENPTLPSLETTISTDTQGALDIALVQDLYVDSEYIISANLNAKTVQVFSATAPYSLIHTISTSRYPLAVYRYSSGLFVSEASTNDYSTSEGRIEVFNLQSGSRIDLKDINVRKPMAIWADGDDLLVGGVWPTSDSDITLAHYKFVVPGENSLPKPNEISSLKIWLRADQGLSTSLGATQEASNNDSVLRWEDLSGNGNHFVQVNSTPPVLKENAINGLPAVKFKMNIFGGNGTTLCLANNSGVMGSCKNLFSAARTIFTVAMLDSNTNYWQNLYSTRIAWDPEDQTAMTIGGPGIFNSNLSWFADSSLDRFSVYPSNSPVNISEPFYIHHYSDVKVPKILYLGGSLGHWIPLDGKIAEILIFEGQLTQSETELVMNYIRSRYSFQAGR